MKKCAIGVDIGGGSVKLGLVGPKGKVISHRSFLTNAAAGRRKLLDTLTDHALGLLKEAKRLRFRVVGVGIGAPGPIDVEKGLVYFFPNIPGWRNTPLKKILERRLGLPVRVDNDANAMAFGEYCYGAGRGVKNIIALTLGTGVGGGLVIQGKLFHGSTFSAAEIGHMIINEEGPLCACGNRGCLETYVGSGYFVRHVKERLKKSKQSILNQWVKKDSKVITPLLVAEAAKKGDAFSKEIWHETGGHLGKALAGLVNVLNPEKIVLGGGIAQNGDLIFRPVRQTIKKKAFPVAARSVKVVPAKLGVEAGLIGAAALVLKES